MSTFQSLPVEILFEIAKYLNPKQLRKSVTICSVWHAVTTSLLYKKLEMNAMRFQRLASSNATRNMELFTQGIEYSVPTRMGSNRHWHSNKGRHDHDRPGSLPIAPDLFYTTLARCEILRSFSVKFIEIDRDHIRLHDRYDLGLIGAFRYCNLQKLEINTIDAMGWDEPVPCTAAFAQVIAQLDTVTLRMKHICPKILEYICPLELEPHLVPAYPPIPGTTPTTTKYPIAPADIKLKGLTIILADICPSLFDSRRDTIPSTRFSYRCGAQTDTSLLQSMLDGAAALAQRAPTIEHLWIVGTTHFGRTASFEAWDLAKGVRRVFPPAVWQTPHFDATANHLSTYNCEVDARIEEVE
ncbi:hypothetical protein N7540_001811 [Penicillium herquei]|nr:hypothetical protein N7540_001811 [Penicillium herquei]